MKTLIVLLVIHFCEVLPDLGRSFADNYLNNNNNYVEAIKLYDTV